jgi:hypothetical protein
MFVPDQRFDSTREACDFPLRAIRAARIYGRLAPDAFRYSCSAQSSPVHLPGRERNLSTALAGIQRAAKLFYLLKDGRRLGHGPVAFTLQVYWHLLESTKRETAEKMNAVLARSDSVAPSLALLSIEAKRN